VVGLTDWPGELLNSGSVLQKIHVKFLLAVPNSFASTSLSYLLAGFDFHVGGRHYSWPDRCSEEECHVQLELPGCEAALFEAAAAIAMLCFLRCRDMNFSDCHRRTLARSVDFAEESNS